MLACQLATPRQPRSFVQLAVQQDLHGKYMMQRVPGSVDVTGFVLWSSAIIQGCPLNCSRWFVSAAACSRTIGLNPTWNHGAPAVLCRMSHTTMAPCSVPTAR